MERLPRLHAFAAIAFGLAVSGWASAQTTLEIWPGVAPGSQDWTWEERVIPDTPYGTIVQNVVTPTLTVLLPPASTATGTGVIVVPGGACVALTMDHEGHDVARWLQQRGIAAFVLKYRLLHKTWEGPPPAGMDMDVACEHGIADGIQAVRVVRRHAAEWGVSPEAIGMLGFSAGGMIASAALLGDDAAARPDFVGLIYGAPFSSMPDVPAAKLPPVFMAWAQDDSIARDAMARFHAALQAAGHAPEVHVFGAGDHGFGLKSKGTSSDHWPQEFCWWLQSRGFEADCTDVSSQRP